MGVYDSLIKGALLHDIGKVLYRADQSVGNHSKAGRDFLSNYFADKDEKKKILNCVSYHHGKTLANAKLQSDDLAYIVYEADNLSSAIDRRLDEGVSSESGFDTYMPLKSIFHTFSGEGNGKVMKYYLRGLDATKPFNYPTSGEIRASVDKYKLLVDALIFNFRNNIEDMSCDEILRFYEDITAYVPSSTCKKEVADISLYMHSKITAALAVCMLQYFEEHGITDYKKECFTKKEEFRTKEAFLLVSGDFSGIQKFIYTIPSKGALKSLRGRSSYLEILLEHIIDSILRKLDLARTNVLYTGGGHFYLILPATQKAKEIVAAECERVNQWLLKNIGIGLYLAVGMSPCTGDDLINSTGQRKIFTAVSKLVKKAKMQRYDADTLSALFNPNSIYNKVLDSSRECSICHISTLQLTSYGDADSNQEACPMCTGLYNLGAEIVKKENSCFVIAKSNDTNEALQRIPVYGEELYLYVVNNNKIEDFAKTHEIINIYSKNEALTGNFVSTRLWLADYAAKNKRGEILELGELAELSGYIDENGVSKGINRLGVLRADVDNLGAAFISGFIRDEGSEVYGTFSRYADLSRDLSLFFKVAVNKLAKGETPESTSGINPFTLFKANAAESKPVHIIYSGGDDVFIVGAWDTLIELAVTIREAFTAFTQGKITLSAGLSLFSSSYPISKMADLAGELESQAKNNPNKDSLALFGINVSNEGTSSRQTHTHHWDDFIHSVCGEKLKMIMTVRELQVDEKPILPISRSLLYRMMNLVKAYDDDTLNFSRLLYTLARIGLPSTGDNELKQKRTEAYNRFTQSIYKWVRNKKDRNELLTALNLILYYEREK